MASLLAAAVLLPSCSSPPPAPETPKGKAPVIVGKIGKVFPQYKFVLIRQNRPIAIPAKNTVLLSQDDKQERIANLMVTEERLPGSEYFAADIRSGHPQAGDVVFLYESLANGQKGVSVLDPGEDQTVTKPEDVKFPGLTEPENFPSDKEIEAMLKDTAELPQ